MLDQKSITAHVTQAARAGSGLMQSFFPKPAFFPKLAFNSLTLGRIGSLEVRLAATKKDVKRAQRLRYTIFCEEMSAVPDLISRLKRRDIDAFDAARAVCLWCR